MSETDANPSQAGSFNPGSIVWRVLVPAWIATGAVFKLLSASPRTLPESLLDLADDLGVGLYPWLALLIGLEFLAIAIMLFVRPLARLMAVFMLASFCAILVIEMAVYGNIESCGCLGGSVKMPPWIMLSVDGALLLATLALGRKPLGLMGRSTKASCACWSKTHLISAAVVTVLGFGVSFGRLMPLNQSPTPNGENPVAITPDPTGTGTQTPPPTTPGLPAVFRTRDSDVESWVGSAWSDIALSKFVPKSKTSQSTGRVHVIFYRRSWDHCQEMFDIELTGNLPVPVIGVEVPETRRQMRDPDNTWPMPETNVELLQLPLGPDWIITTPLIVSIEDGIVKCAEQGDHQKCYYYFE